MENQIMTSETTLCTMATKTQDEKMALYNMLNNPEKKLKEMINVEINMAHVYCEPVSLTNEKTGEVNETHRTIIVDTDGVSYTTVSMGIFDSLKNLLNIFGLPADWENGALKVKVVQIPTNKGANNILKLVLVK